MAAAALVACGAFAGSAFGIEREDFIRLSGSVVKVESMRAQGGVAIGSGVVVAAERVVTNCHVTREALALAVVRRGERWPVQAQAVDARHDLCVLQVDGLPAQPVPLGRAGNLHIGQRVAALGYTGGVGLQASDGDVVALHPFDGAPVVQSTNWFTSGASGGGLFDEQSRLVAILTFRMRGGESHYFAAPAEWIAPQLSPLARYAPVEPMPGIEPPYWQRPAASQPEFLQAATLAQGGRWRELEALALRWTEAAPREPQSWFSRGLAEEGLGHLPAALDAFERSVSLDAAFAAGWLRIGLLSARMGLPDRARQALQTLRSLDADAATRLAARIEPK